MQANVKVSILFCLILCSFPRVVSSQQKGNSPEQILFQAANRDRAAHGVPPLVWDAELAKAAHQHSTRMAQQGTLSHQFPGETDLSSRSKVAGARFDSIGENVAQGPSAPVIHEQWMHSPPHRRNLLDPDFNSVGIAVVERNRTLFATEDFSHSISEKSLDQQESQVGAALKSHGLQLLNYTTDARKSCPLDRGYAGAHVPAFVIHYFTADLDSLPDVLLERINSGEFHHAAVGACASHGQGGFSGYRIAVLLFK
ncbi:MAG: CAP domain-containing protein [Candidatus Acidiferrales bacterium]